MVSYPFPQRRPFLANKLFKKLFKILTRLVETLNGLPGLLRLVSGAANGWAKAPRAQPTLGTSACGRASQQTRGY